jgi:hypothetical protein
VTWLLLVAYFVGGFFLTNAIPHLVSGIMGQPFQSPFAQPRGKGLSSSTVNVLWGFFNAVVGYLLVVQVGHVASMERPYAIHLIASGSNRPSIW